MPAEEGQSEQERIAALEEQMDEVTRELSVISEAIGVIKQSLADIRARIDTAPKPVSAFPVLPPVLGFIPIFTPPPVSSISFFAPSPGAITVKKCEDQTIWHEDGSVREYRITGTAQVEGEEIEVIRPNMDAEKLKPGQSRDFKGDNIKVHGVGAGVNHGTYERLPQHDENG